MMLRSNALKTEGSPKRDFTHHLSTEIRGHGSRAELSLAESFTQNSCALAHKMLHSTQPNAN